MQKRMFKVICAMERRNGGKYWMRLGSGFTNKDESINVYLDAIPVGKGEVTLQLRELTDEDLRESAEKRAAYAARNPSATTTTTSSDDSLPF